MGRAKKETVDLRRELVTRDFVCASLIDDFEDVSEALRRVEPGRRADGQSHFYSVFEGRSSRLKLERGSMASLNRLKRYDTNLLDYEAVIGRGRPGFKLKYFQYLAALLSEIWLDELSRDAVGLAVALEEFRQEHYPDQPSIVSKDVWKVAFWMATGSGKTLLMHVNLLQARHYLPSRLKQTLVLAPTKTLAMQHLEELHKSGFREARHAKEPGGDRASIQVIEITKLYVNGPGTRAPKGGESLPTDLFRGPNLVLVDEGHKGTATVSDSKVERAWKLIRKSLHGDKGLTLEYSATFRQVTEKDEVLRREYGRAILYEYAYAKFHRDGFGKGYEILNVRDAESHHRDTPLIGAVLALYEQLRVYETRRGELAEYGIARPLMLFVGQNVNAGPKDVQQIVMFLDGLLGRPEEAKAQIKKIMEGGVRVGGVDPFAGRFPALRRWKQSIDALYEDLCQRVFHGSGRLELCALKSGDGEIGLRTSDSSQDRYFGVINVGSAGVLLKNLGAAGAVVRSDDHLSKSVFGEIEGDESPIHILIGARKFVEGWSSWRVSVMGLLRVGKSKGAQIVQLFGRGVRLRGLGGCLKRSSALPGPHPADIERLETLTIFGLKSNYLQTFLGTLGKEVAIEERRVIRVEVPRAWQSAGLKVIETDGSYRFEDDQIVRLGSVDKRIVVDLSVAMDVGSDGDVRRLSQKLPESLLGDREDWLSKLDVSGLLRHGREYKRKKRWGNVYLDRSDLRSFLRTRMALKVPGDFDPETDRGRELLQSAAVDALEKGLDRARYQAHARAEKSHVRPVGLDVSHPNFPVADEGGKEVSGYTLYFPEEMAKEVDGLLAQSEALCRDTSCYKEYPKSVLPGPLPRLCVGTHLFHPLALSGSFGLTGLGKVTDAKDLPSVRYVPKGLERSEVQFTLDLQQAWDNLQGDERWEDKHLWLLRNMSVRGVGFFASGGFYPDFLLWMTCGDRQALAFIDPKGMTYGHWDKVELKPVIEELSLQAGFEMTSYIVTPTVPKDIPVPEVSLKKQEEWLRVRGVLLQKDKYISEILDWLEEQVSG